MDIFEKASLFRRGNIENKNHRCDAQIAMVISVAVKTFITLDDGFQKERDIKRFNVDVTEDQYDANILHVTFFAKASTSDELDKCRHLDMTIQVALDSFQVRKWHYCR